MQRFQRPSKSLVRRRFDLTEFLGNFHWPFSVASRFLHFSRYHIISPFVKRENSFCSNSFLYIKYSTVYYSTKQINIYYNYKTPVVNK